jgi:Tfp pilus assembly protein PilN
MKVNCDFLPKEYKSFLLDVQALAVVLVLTALTAGACVFSLTAAARERATLTSDNQRAQSDLADVINQLKSVTYDQVAIQELITKFQFIQRAMGASDYPYLRFYQKLENALPRSPETQLKKVAVQQLQRQDGERFSISGKARERTDITQFEKNMDRSRSGTRQDFQEVKILNSTYDPRAEEWSFEMQFTFVP